MEQFPNEYFGKMKDIEENLIRFFEKQDKFDENFLLFNNYLQDQKISKNKYQLKALLHLIVAISNHYHRSQNFFSKIELILKNLQSQIQSFFSSFEVFHIFQTNKRLLLSLFKLGIIIPNNEIFSIINGKKKYIDRKYIEYFYSEFEQYIDEKIENSFQELKNEDFQKKRENGENDNYLCELIRNDLISDFVSYLGKTNISISSSIHPSIYETNLFLLDKNPSLIEYSSFYGSIQIFKYLYHQNAELTSSIWEYAVHGRNAEIIHLLEDKNIPTQSNSFQYLIIESIKCHHNELADYFTNKLCENEKTYINFNYRKSLKYYNFSFFTDDIISHLITSCFCNQELNILYYLCKYDYYLIVEFLLKNSKLNSQSANTLNINHQYTIYKPLIQIKKENIVYYIKISNGDVNQIPKIDEELKNDAFFYNRELKIRKYTKYEYDIENLSIIHIAIRKGNIDIIQLLINSQKINLKSQSILNYKEKKKSIIIPNEYYLVEERRDLLHEAVESGYAEVVQFLQKNISSFNVNSIIFLKRQYHDCITTGHWDYEENYTEPLLHFAIKRGNIEILKLLLLDPNININSKSISQIKESGGCVCSRSFSRIIKKSSLYYAVNNENIKLIHLLLEMPEININSGIEESYSDYNVQNKIVHVKTPLYLAVEKENLEIVQLLVEMHKIKINFESIISYKGSDVQKKTALQLAYEKQNNEIIQVLLEHNTDENTNSSDGSSEYF